MKKGMKFYHDKKFWVWVAMAIIFCVVVYYGWTQYILKYPDATFF